MRLTTQNFSFCTLNNGECSCFVPINLELLTQYLRLPLQSAGQDTLVVLGNLAADGSALALILFLIITLWIVGSEPFKRWKPKRRTQRYFKTRQQKAELLLAGSTRESVLQSSPFQYARWPDGDNNYLINDIRIGQTICHASSPVEAELWILEHTFNEIGRSRPTDKYQQKKYPR